MSKPDAPIVLFFYPFSPWSAKITTYLSFRGIPYTECIQPVTLPRPDLNALGVKYRRIPVMSIGRDIYCDTLIMLEKLEELFPYADGAHRMSATKGHNRALEKLLEKWTDAVVFKYAAAAIPTSNPVMGDKNFTDDREDLWGRDWDAKHQNSLRPEGLANLRRNMEFLEHDLLEDGRDWVLAGDQPTLSDIHAAWIFIWLVDMDDALPKDVFGAKNFPKAHAWFERYKKAVEKAKEGNKGNVKELSGPETVKQISEGPFGDRNPAVDPLDPTGLKQGDWVQGWPTDTGFNHRDVGKLVGLTSQESVIATKAESGAEIRIHHPRWQFIVEPAKS